jgi:hypothetical protein
MSKPFRRGILSRIALAVATPVAAVNVTPEEMQEKVAVLRGDWR